MIALVLLLCPPAAIVPLQPETGPRVTFKECYQGFQGSGKQPASVNRAPEGNLTWFVFPWGDGEAVVAVGENRLWPDRDGDGDLAEEDAVVKPREYESVEFTLKLKLPSQAIDARLEVCFIGRTEMRVNNLTRMSGKVAVDGREMAVSLTDYLANGRYDDVYTTKTTEYWLCDHAHLDMDGDGKFLDRVPPQGEDFALAKNFVVGDAVYAFEVLDRGERLRFEKTGTPLVTVKVNLPAYSIALVSDALGACHLGADDEGTGRLPAGHYRLDYYDYEWKGARVDGYWRKDEGNPFFDIREGAEFALNGKLRYELHHEVAENGTLIFWTICFGPNGERVEVTPSGEGDNIEPVVSVESTDGKELFSKKSRWC